MLQKNETVYDASDIRSFEYRIYYGKLKPKSNSSV